MVDQPEVKQKKTFSPSTLSYQGACPRRWYYAFRELEWEPTIKPLNRSIMESGSDAGVRIAKLFEDAGILVEAEREVWHEDPGIHGFIDAVVNWKGQEILVEVKTTSNSNWNKRMISNSVPPYQMIQLLIYMYIEGYDRGIFYTENNDTKKVFILPVVMTDERRAEVERVFQWMRDVEKASKEDTLPKRPFNKSSLQCKGCPFRTRCWDGWTRGSKNGTDPNPGEADIPALELKC